MRRREGEDPPLVTCETEESVVVNKFNFLAFIVEVLCNVKYTKNNSDVVRSVVQAAERILGIRGIEPSILHNPCSQKTKGQNTLGTKWKMVIFILLMFCILQWNARLVRYQFGSKWARV